MVGSIEKDLQGPEAEQLVQDVGNETLALGEAQGRLSIAIEHPDDEVAQLRLGLTALHLRKTVEIQPIEQLLMNTPLQGLILRMARIGAEWRD